MYFAPHKAQDYQIITNTVPVAAKMYKNSTQPGSSALCWMLDA